MHLLSPIFGTCFPQDHTSQLKLCTCESDHAITVDGPHLHSEASSDPLNSTPCPKPYHTHFLQGLAHAFHRIVATQQYPLCMNPMVPSLLMSSSSSSLWLLHLACLLILLTAP